MAKEAGSSTSGSTPSHDEIAAQAYQIYLREGCAEGHDLDHWLRAEAELRERATSGNSNGQIASESQRQQQTTSAPRAVKQQEQASVLPSSISPPSKPITQVTRSATPRRNSGKREAATAGR